MNQYDEIKNLLKKSKMLFEQKGPVNIAKSIEDDLEKKLGVPIISLIKIDIKTFTPDQIPAELSNIPAIKPGSRFLKT